MRLNSFRLKIALLSGLITGVLAIGSGMVLWRMTYRFNLDALDREMRNIGQANLERVLGGDHWQRLDDALKFVAGRQADAAYVLWVKNNDRVIYQSTGWPAGIAPDVLPVFDGYESPDGPKPGQPLPPPPRRGEEISPRNPPLPRKSAQFFTQASAGKSWRVGVMGNPYMTLVLAADIDTFNHRMQELRNRFLAFIPAVLVLAAGGAWLVARWALRPLTSLTRTAERVTARGLDQRIPAMARDQEFNRLITVFNEMLDRLEKSFQQATRFSADASHELRTPLARLQAELESALRDAPADSPQQTAIVSQLDEVHWLTGLVEKLLLLSRADAGRLALTRERTDLSAMVANVAEDCQAQAANLTIERTVKPGVSVEADAALLEQALQNLSSNAVKYNRAGGRIRFELSDDAGHAVFRMANTGPGISAENRGRLFQRFHRADPSRGRIEGLGLGLSLAREIVRAHGGDLEIEPAEGEWTTFRVRLPRTA